MKTVFLKISNKEIHFNETDYIPIEKTNLPYEDMRFNTEYQDIFWEVELIKFDEENEELYVKVTDYNPHNRGSFRDQRFKYPFYRINFELLDWQQVEQQLSSYRISAIKDYFFGLTTSQRAELRNSSWPDPDSMPTGPVELEPVGELPTKKDKETVAFKRRIEEVIRISFLEFRFYEGFVSTSKMLKNTAVPTEIVIHNPAFRQEFEYIKEYFVRYFGRKTVKVFIDYELDSDKITDLNCKCPDLEGIDDSVIEAIKVKRTNILRKPNKKETKSILDLAEIFHLMNDPSAGINVFDQSEEDILNHFINLEGIRNKQQLSYLAYDLQLSTEKIRFTIHPIFGFVFFYKTNNNSYFIWELLDSHATYIWYVENSVMSSMSLFMELEKAIEYIKTLGREVYKQAYNEGKVNSTILFKPLYHKRNKASGFQDWLGNLNSIIEN